MPEAPRGARAPRMPRWRWDVAALAVVAYLPLLLTRRGLLADDTKIYLYLDPGRLVSNASSLWSHDTAFGTVTHQNIGYLFPMGPYFWITKSLGVPVWIAQRFWMGSLLFLAALGIMRLAQELGLSRRAGFIAAWPYMLTPFILVNLDRTSALLMPWAGLGWMMLFTIRAARRNDWRNPALFALVVFVVGGVNATSVLMVGFAPLVYLVYAAHAGEITWRRSGLVMARIGLLSLLVSLWWMSGLWAESHYGINVLKFTESFATVSTTSTSSEVLRGLGYWYFYGWDQIQPWTLTMLSYTSGHVVPAMSFVAPVVGVVAALLVRWKYRVLAVITVFVGIVVAVGSYPLQDPTPFGVIFKWVADHTTVGLAMRSSNRVLPIAIIWLCLLIGAGYDALRPRLPRLAHVGAIVVTACAMAAMLPLFEGKAISSNLTFPSKLPAYVDQVAALLNKGAVTSAVMGLPGQDFAYYRYGTANDSVWPGIIKRPWISSQVAPEGEPASANLIRGLDSALQNNIAEPSSIAPIARLFGVGDLLVQMDTQYERFSTPLPAYMWALLHPTPAGLHLIGTYGPNSGFQAVNGPYINEQLLGFPLTTPLPNSLALYKVDGGRPLVRTENTAAPQIVAGDGEGLVVAATMGLLDHQRAIYYDASMQPTAVNELASQPGAWLVLTDSNQKRWDQFGTLSATAGYVETSTEQPLVVAHNEVVSDVFPNQPVTAQTVALMKGLAAVGASGYGNIITNNPEVQPYKAVDGTLDTSWQVSAFSPAIGQFFQMTAYTPQTITKLHIVQPLSSTQNRWITKIGISIDGGAQIVRPLGANTRNAPGGDVTIPATTGRTIRVTILDVTGHDHALPQASSVGFAELTVAGFGPVTRGLLAPTSLLDRSGPGAATDRLTVVFDRMRAATHPVRLDPEYYLLRYFQLPYARSFTMSGYANFNPAISDDQLNYMLGRHAGPGVSVIGAESSSRLGSLYDTAWDAFDGNPATGWAPKFNAAPGEWVKVDLNQPTTLTDFNMTVVNDGYHMIPTEMTVSNGTTTEKFSVPITMATQNGQLNRTESVHIKVPAISGREWKFTVTAMHAVPVIDRIGGGVAFPSYNLVDIKFPGVSPGVTPPTYDSGCRSDLLSVNGRPVPVRVRGSTADVLALNRLAMTTCSSAPFVLPAGTQSIQSAPGYKSGLNINDVALNSPATGPSAPSSVEGLSAWWDGQTTLHATVPQAMAGRLLVLGQSYSPGWHAVLAGKDLGTPRLVDGAAMGWQLPAKLSATLPITFNWQPQRVIDIALFISVAAVLLVLAMAITNRPRRRVSADSTPVDDESFWGGWGARLHERPLLLYGTALVAGLAISPYAVPVFLALALVWIKWRTLGRWMAIASSVAVSAAAAFTVVATQLPYVHDITWPAHVRWANSAAWIGVGLWILVIVGNKPFGDGPTASRPHNAPENPDGDATTPTPGPLGDGDALAPNGADAGVLSAAAVAERALHARRSPYEETDAGETAQSTASDQSPGDLGPDERVLDSNAAAASLSSIESALTAADEIEPPRPPHAPPAIAAAVAAGRRRGLNMPEQFQPTEEEPEPPVTLVPPVGLHRTRFLLRAGWELRHDPEEWHAIVAQDVVNQMVGKTPIYNRRVLDITESSTGHAEELRLRGGHVTSMRRAGFSWPDPDVLEFSSGAIAAADESFDLVFATDVLSSVPDPAQLIDELVRVTRRGGTLYFQNRMWDSPWGGHDTSPWHLLGGQRARRRYVRKHGHEPRYRFNENLFKVHPGPLAKQLRSHPGLVVFIAGPRVLPTSWSWTLRLPLLRNLLVQDLIVVAERR